MTITRSRSALVRHSLSIEQAIEIHCASGPGLHRQRLPMRRELLRVLALRAEDHPLLSQLPINIGRIRKLLSHRIWRVSCALYLWKKHRVSKQLAARLTDVYEGELDYVVALAQSTRDSLHELADQADRDVLAEIDGYLEELTVSLDQRAIEDLLLAAAESYAVGPGGRGRRYTEIYGLCFGTRKLLGPNGHPGYSQILNVTRIVTQIRARGRASEVTPNDKSAKIHRKVAERFFRHLELLGDYHTHPFSDLSALKARRGWEYSPSDQASVMPWLEDTRAEGADPRFGLILGIARGGKAGRHAARRAPNRIQFTLDDYYFILAAYRIRRDGMYDSKITLDCPQVSA